MAYRPALQLHLTRLTNKQFELGEHKHRTRTRTRSTDTDMYTETRGAVREWALLAERGDQVRDLIRDVIRDLIQGEAKE